MRPMHRSVSNTSKSFGPQSMAPRRFLLACLNERTHRRVLDSSFVLLGRTWRRFGELSPLDIRRAGVIRS
jgi:hypothetical protein